MLIKKIAKFTLVSLTCTIIAFYFAFWSFLKWGELSAEQGSKNDRAVLERSFQTHKLSLLNEGVLSFAERLKAIQSAQKSIELEFFIYDLDQSSRILTQELIEKAQSGVKVRILVDFAAPVFKLAPDYVFYLQNKGIEVRYYNTSKFYRIFAYQHRSHRKLLIIDDRILITGGRNIANDYFDLSSHYNFLDSDIIIEGEIVKKVRSTFDLYWNSQYASVNAVNPLTPTSAESKRVQSFFKDNFEDDELASQIIAASSRKPLKAHSCEDLSFVSDLPGVSASHRKVYWALKELFLEAKEEILGESPYFVMASEGLELLSNLNKNGIATTVLTNSLNSTDAYYTVSPLYSDLKKIAATQTDVWVYTGAKPELSQHPFPEIVSDRWGVHSKRAIIDAKHLVIGTYNVDPRSANLNSEIVFICRNNAALAQESKDDFNKRLLLSRPLIQKGDTHKKNLFVEATLKQKILFWISLPLATSFSFLL